MFINILILLYTISYVYGSFYVKLYSPGYTEVGKRATFQCYTSLHPKEIDRIHWYKNGSRFYRFKPGSDEPKQKYNLDEVDVDLEYSNLTHASFIANLHSEGVYSCEVISKGLAYITHTSTDEFKVFYIPSKPISIQRNSYGNLLTCITKPTYPSIDLIWTINGERAPEEDISKLLEETLYNGTKITRLDLRIRPKTKIKYECRGNMNIKLNNELITIGYFKTSLTYDGDYFPEILNERLDSHHNYEKSNHAKSTKNNCINLLALRFTIVTFLLINKYLA